MRGLGMLLGAGWLTLMRTLAVRAADLVAGGDLVDARLVFEDEIGAAEILASLVAIRGRLDGDGDNGSASDRWQGWQAGTTIELFGPTVGGSFADQRVGDLDRTFFTVGIGWRRPRAERLRHLRAGAGKP